MSAGRQVFGGGSEFVELAVEVFAMLADVTRVRIVLALVNEGGLSVSRLAERAGKLPTVVSQHLAKLRLARMVAARREGTTVFYQLVDEHAADLVRHAVMQAEHAVANGAVPPHHQVAGAAEEISA